MLPGGEGAIVIEALGEREREKINKSSHIPMLE